ncbi:hypothetical protein L218DRAFT_954949 [Marasmius fiardii PR-910]|nr:hypothetical protein L218DRAFT_954949 [Marasmius fiardii PR-910]
MYQTIPSGLSSEDEEIFIPPLDVGDAYVDLDETPDPSPTETTSSSTTFRSPTPRARTPTPATYSMDATYTEGPSTERTQSYKQWPLRLNHYRQSKQQWRAVSKSHHEKLASSLPKKITVATWNVDFASHFPKERIQGALEELRDDILDVDESTGKLQPCVVLLQEVHSSMLEMISSSPWVRQNFYVTPLRWPFPHVYGNVTLVHRSLQIEKAFLLEYRLSEGARSAVMIDVKIRSGRVLRVINTHLESLPRNAGTRKEQLAMCARYCKVKEVIGGIICGDLNAIDCDSEEQVENLGLQDSFQRGRHDHPEEGFTWGYQCNIEADKRLPKGRLDKILFTPGRGFYVERPEVVGKGARIESGGGYVSDHFGLAARIVVE